MKVVAFFIVPRTWSLDGAAPWARAFSGARVAAIANVAVVVAIKRRRVRGLSGMTTRLSQDFRVEAPRRKDAARWLGGSGKEPCRPLAFLVVLPVGPCRNPRRHGS